MRPCSLRGEARDGEDEANKKGSLTTHGCSEVVWGLQHPYVPARAQFCAGLSICGVPTCPLQHSHLPTLHTSLLPSLRRLQNIRGVAPKWPAPGPPSPLRPPGPAWGAAGPPLPAVIPAQLQPQLSLSRRQLRQARGGRAQGQCGPETRAASGMRWWCGHVKEGLPGGSCAHPITCPAHSKPRLVQRSILSRRGRKWGKTQRERRAARRRRYLPHPSTRAWRGPCRQGCAVREGRARGPSAGHGATAGWGEAELCAGSAPRLDL